MTIDLPMPPSTNAIWRAVGKGSDLGNREKAVSDFLQAIGVIDDDNLAERILLQWGAASLGCRVLVEPARQAGTGRDG